jgi:hypothetical protein
MSAGSSWLGLQHEAVEPLRSLVASHAEDCERQRIDLRGSDGSVVGVVCLCGARIDPPVS